jgi:GntR family transcriptional regulator
VVSEVSIRVDKRSGVPIHSQIQEQIVALVHAGKIRAGEQLPTIRSLAIELAVNVNTVAHAYRELDRQGIIATRRGEGTFVAATPSDEELLHLRAAQLRRLVEGMVSEAEQLGYAVDEIAAVLHDRLGHSAPGPTE